MAVKEEAVKKRAREERFGDEEHKRRERTKKFGVDLTTAPSTPEEEPPAPKAKAAPKLIRGTAGKDAKPAEAEEPAKYEEWNPNKVVVTDFRGTLVPTGYLAGDWITEEDDVVPQASRQAVKRLTDAGFTVAILSYIGEQGDQSKRRREVLEQARVELAKWLGYATENPDKPTAGRIHATCCNAPTWALRKGQSRRTCKAQYLCRWGAPILLDDRSDVAADCEKAGTVVYQVCEEADRATGQQRTKNKHIWQSRVLTAEWSHESSWSFGEAVDKVLSDFQTGDIKEKLFDVDEAASVEWKEYRARHGLPSFTQ